MSRPFQVIYLMTGTIVALMQGAALVKNENISYRVLKELHRAFIIDRPWISLVLVIILFLIGIAAICSGSKSDNRSIIKSLLDSLHSTYFDKCLPEDRYKHRISIFTPNIVNIGTSDKPIYQKRLHLYVRSGVSYQKTEASFIINEEKEEDNEGVPGRAWFINGPVKVDLPELDNKEEYAKKMFLSVARVDALSVKPLSIYAVPLSIDNQRFGVLVIDSRISGALTNQPEKINIINSTLALINNLPKA